MISSDSITLPWASVWTRGTGRWWTSLFVICRKVWTHAYIVVHHYWDCRYILCRHHGDAGALLPRGQAGQDVVSAQGAGQHAHLGHWPGDWDGLVQLHQVATRILTPINIMTIFRPVYPRTIWELDLSLQLYQFYFMGTKNSTGLKMFFFSNYNKCQMETSNFWNFSIANNAMCNI